MKIYYHGRYVKNVPAKYANIPDLPDYFEDIDSPRLSVKECRILDMALFNQKIASFLVRLKVVFPMDYWLIEKSSPVMAHEVATDDNQIYYSLLFRNGFAIRINKRIYNLCPIKGEAPSSSPLVALPPFEQLKLSFS
jgi:hypothetical protein